MVDNGTIHHGPVGQEECVRLVFTLIAVYQSNGMKVFENLNQAFFFVFSPTGETQPKQEGLKTSSYYVVVAK